VLRHDSDGMWVPMMFYGVASTTVDRCLVQASVLHSQAMNESQATYRIRLYSLPLGQR
jgi:hypothetical protein